MDRPERWAIVVPTVAAAAAASISGAAFSLHPLLIAAATAGCGIAAALLVPPLIARDREARTGRVTVTTTDPVLPPPMPQMLHDLPVAAILLDRHSRLHSMNGAALALFDAAASGAPLPSIIRASPVATAVAETALSQQPSMVEFAHMRAGGQRLLRAHIRALEDSASNEGPAILVLIEDHTRSARVEQVRRDFIANASHELKTPLAALSGFIETLQGAAADDAEARARFLPVMAAEAQRMRRLIDDLMSLNRIEIDEHVRPSERVDLGALVLETAAALRPLAERTAVMIDVALPKSGPHVAGDRDQLRQLFSNLIDNAIKYGGDGGIVRVHLAPDEPERAGMIGVTVADLGPGIAREHLPRLTERFYRVSESRSGAKGGTGLGLSIVKHILTRHRGDLMIRSRPGEGTSFTAWLPREADSDAQKDS